MPRDQDVDSRAGKLSKNLTYTSVIVNDSHGILELHSWWVLFSIGPKSDEWLINDASRNL